MSRENRDEGPTRLFSGKRGMDLFRELMGKRGDRSSHEVGPEPRNRIPPGCTGDPHPTDRYYHRNCVVADRWARACAVGNCQYWDAQAMKPDPDKDCPGHRGTRSIRHGQCFVTWDHCPRRTKWGEVHEQTGKHAKPIGGPKRPLLPTDEPNPWDRPLLTNGRDPGEEG